MAEQAPLAAWTMARNSVPGNLASVYERNQPYVLPGQHSFNTQLPTLQEFQFRKWLGENKVPFEAEAPVTDYDMRGFYMALQAGDPRATSAVNSNDGQMHYPDVWKTPYHETFSADSQWARPNAPQWNDQDQLVGPNGRILFDERAQKRK